MTDRKDEKPVKVDISPKANTSESKNAESELSEQVRDYETHNIPEQKEELKLSDIEFSLPSIDKSGNKMEQEGLLEKQKLVTPAVSEDNPYKNRILLLRKYTDSIMSEVKEIEDMSLSGDKAQTLKLIEEECSNIANLLKKIMPHIALGSSYCKGRAGVDGGMVRNI